MSSDTYKRLIGARILSEANDLKRHPSMLARELGLEPDHLARVLGGRCELDELHRVMDLMSRRYPIDGADLRLPEDDCTHGVRIMRAKESEASARVAERPDASGRLSPYYEYRDTALSRLSPFRPEWIRPLRFMPDVQPESGDVALNAGHLLHQYTFYVGPINFYGRARGELFGHAMNTGDSTYGTPWWPHTFGTRDPDRRAYILAVTFGSDAKRAQRELYALGPRTRRYVLDYRRHRRAMVELLDQHLANEMLTRAELARTCRARQVPIDPERLFDESCEVSPEEIAAVARVLDIEPSDLLIPVYTGAEEIIVRRRAQDEPRAYPDADRPRYHVWPMARLSRMAQMKGFALDVLRSDLDLEGTTESGLHAWIYNYGEAPVAVIWSDGEATELTILEPNDSMYAQPFIRYAFANVTERRGALCEVRVAGAVNLATQRELSYLSEVDRIYREDRVWY